jgi:group I intron endonuclease
VTCDCYKCRPGELPRGGVYAIQNLVNQHLYVGSTLDFWKRWVLHRHLLRKGKHHARHLQSAWSKYGEESFRFLPLVCIAGKEGRLAIEQHLLDTLSTVYNVSRIARSSEGCTRSPETRDRLRKSMQDPHRLAHIRELGKKPKSPEQRALMAEAQRGRHHSEETRAKMRASSARRWARR